MGDTYFCRAARVEDLATRSISGHHTERMQQHYSTVRGNEQQASIAKVIDLMTVRTNAEATPQEGPGGAPPAPGGAPDEKAG